MLTHDASLTAAIWEQFLPRIVPEIDAEDDADLWSAAIGHIMADAQFLCENAATTQAVFTEIGRCSHWVRPHQARWTADGGFAWPSGYGGSGFSLSGLPEWDWSLIWQWNADGHKWQSTGQPLGKRRLQLRISIPSRTVRHDQAAIHTIWRPGCPTMPNQSVRQLYGLRKLNGAWLVTAYQCSNDKAYDCKPSEQAT
ncbi:MAG: hypothetical protein SH850_08175 [Planctomycetaceae bacterium]|nr:hypothetical protein [Planctomycetaceae bacterium]